MRVKDRELAEQWQVTQRGETPTEGEAHGPTYEPPLLVVLGDVRSLTLGGPSGVGDSPAPGVQLG